MPPRAPEHHNQDTDRNPGQKHQDELAQLYDAQGNLRTLDEGVASKEGAVDQARERLKKQEATQATSGPTDLNDIKKAEATTPWQTNVAPDKTSSLSKQALKKVILRRWAIGGIFSAIFGILTGVSGLTIFEIPHLNRLSNDKAHHLTNRFIGAKQAKARHTRYFTNPDTCRGVKIKCRFHRGLSENEIKKLEKAGMRPEVGVGNNGKRYIKSFTVTNTSGELIKIDKDNWFSELDRNPNLHVALKNSAASPGIVKTLGKGAMQVMRKFKVNATDPLGKPATEQEARRNARKNLYENRDNLDADDFSDSKEQSDAVKEQAKEYLPVGEGDAKWDVPVIPTLDPSAIDITPEHAANAVQDAAKGGIKGAIMSVAAVPDKICSAYDLLRKTYVLAKVYKLASLIVYAHMFLTISSKLQAGDVTPYEVSMIMSMALAGSVVKGSEGKNFFNSEGWFLISQGKIRNPNALAKYTNGGTFYGYLKTANETVKKLADSAGINLRRDCGAVKSVWGQIILGVIGVVVSVGSLGTATVVGIVGSTALAITISVIEQFAIPMLASYAAGTFAPDPQNPEGGYGMGNAFAAGLMAFSGESSKHSGLRPLKKSEYATAVAQATEYDNKIAAFEGRGKNPFDLNDPYSITNQVVLTALPFTTSHTYAAEQGVVAALSPFSLLRGAISPSFMANPAFAADSDPYGNQYCEDEDILEMDLATDAFCNVLYGDDLNRIYDPQYSPDAVNAYMVDNHHVDGETGAPISEEYKNYLADCRDDTTPLLADGGGTSIEDNENSNGGTINTRQCYDTSIKYNMFRDYIGYDVIAIADDQAADGSFGKETSIPE